MNRKVLLGVVIALALITAVIHGTFAAGMMRGRPPGAGNRPPAENGGGAPNGNPQQNGGQPGGPNGQPGGFNGQGGGFRPAPSPLGFLRPMLAQLFLANALGYLVLLALIALPVPYFKDHAALTHWLLIAFAALTIVAYFGVNGAGGLRNVLGLVAKADEVLLIVFTYLRLRAVQAGAPAPAAPTASAAAS